MSKATSRFLSFIFISAFLFLLLTFINKGLDGIKFAIVFAAIVYHGSKIIEIDLK